MTAATTRVIRLEPQAPAKPAEGAPCNGCGVCCAWRPCPLGVISTRSFEGPCAALRWDSSRRIYRCGWLLSGPGSASGPGQLWARLKQALARRWIAAGLGCDSSLEVDRGVLPGEDSPNR